MARSLRAAASEPNSDCQSLVTRAVNHGSWNASPSNAAHASGASKPMIAAVGHGGRARSRRACSSASSAMLAATSHGSGRTSPASSRPAPASGQDLALARSSASARPNAHRIEARACAAISHSSLQVMSSTAHQSPAPRRSRSANSARHRIITAVSRFEPAARAARLPVLRKMSPCHRIGSGLGVVMVGEAPRMPRAICSR
ncbi:MAG: hypothetical protein U1E76_23275 [Planctomycetota bacterium]